MTPRARTFAHVFATFGAGGPQLRALQLMAALGAGHRHLVMAMDGRTDALAQLPPGIALELVPPPARAALLATVRAQRRWLRATGADLVLTYNWGAIESALAARSLRLPLVHHEDGFLPDEVRRRKLRRNWLRRIVLRGVPVIVPSRLLHGIAAREWRLRPAFLHHLANGVDLRRFAPGPVPPGEPWLGTVGGLRPEKDHATLLRALAGLPAARLLLVGDGPLRGDLHALAAQLGLAARVEFAGAVTDTAPAYRRCAVFVLSSRTEQMPIALLEAMASGCAVAATAVGDVREVLPPEQQPFVVPPEDPAALAAVLRTLLGDAALRAQLGAANRARVAQRYEAGACLGRFLQVYAATGFRN